MLQEILVEDTYSEGRNKSKENTLSNADLPINVTVS